MIESKQIKETRIWGVISVYGSEEFEDTKGVIRIRISKKHRKHNGQEKKGQLTIYKAWHMKLKIE